MRAATEPEQPVLLPNAVWLSKDASGMPIYGPSFVIPRSSPQPGNANNARPSASQQLTQQECLDVSLAAALGSNLPLVFSRSSGCSLVQVAVEPPAHMVVFGDEPQAPQGDDVIDIDPVTGSPAATPFIAGSGASSSLHLPTQVRPGARMPVGRTCPLLLQDV